MLGLIFQTETESESEAAFQRFVEIFGNDAAWYLILSGIMMLIWFFYEGYRKGGFLRSKKEDWDYDTVSRLLKVLIILGVGLGILDIAIGILSMVLDIPPSYAYRDTINNGYDPLTSISLIILGIAMFFKVLLDVPWASLFGIAAGLAVSIAIATLIPQKWMDYAGTYVNTNYLLIGIFIVVTTVVGLFIKFWVSGAEAIAKIISWPPVSLMVAIYCFVQGFGLLIWGHTLYLF